MTYLVALVAAVASAAPALSLALGLIATDAPVASAAATITVNTTADEAQAGDGTCSLREATLYANGTAEPDCAPGTASGTTSISVPSGVYVLTAGPLSVTGNAALSGGGAATTTITAGGASQVFTVGAAAHAAISDVTVTGGLSGTACGGPSCALGVALFGLPGGGIANDGVLALTRVVVSGNRTSPGAIGPLCNPAGACAGGNGGDGGGISNSKTGTLTIAGSTITGNTTGAGAAGTPGPPDDFPGNSGRGGNGGGISNAGTLTITNSTITGNTTGAGPDGAAGVNGSGNGDGGNASAGGDGGSGAGIENSGPLAISGTTLVGNRTGTGGRGANGGNGSGTGHGGLGSPGGAGGSGGAIDGTADMTVSNSTIVANAAAGGGAPGANGTPSGLGGPGPAAPGIGGAIDQRAMGTTLTHVTITANSAAGAGGGVDGAGGTITVANSIIAGNVAAAPNVNCAGVLTDQGGNIEFAAASCPAGFLRADPGLTGLADNGGPTQTIALRPGGAAIHHVRTCVLAVDQRGAARPVGAACDSGAYQVAPPSVAGVSTGGVTTTTATVAATVNANLQDTTVVVNFGTTPSYGSSTAPAAVGAGNSPVPFSTGLSGLLPNTTYHFDVVARNADGQTTTSDGVFTTLPPLGASIARATTTGPALSLTIACAGGSGPGTCTGQIRLTARVVSKHGRRTRHVAHVVAGGSYSVASGSRVTVRLRLNRMGQNQLSAHYVLATSLSLQGTTSLSRAVTFRYPRIKSPIDYTWSFNGGASTATLLSVKHIPRGGKVTVICHGGGCPFVQRRFMSRHGELNLAPTFQHHPLRAGARLQIQVLAVNQVGKVLTFTIGTGVKLVVTHECFPPGTTRPARCV